MRTIESKGERRKKEAETESLWWFSLTYVLRHLGDIPPPLSTNSAGGSIELNGCEDRAPGRSSSEIRYEGGTDARRTVERETWDAENEREVAGQETSIPTRRRKQYLRSQRHYDDEPKKKKKKETTQKLCHRETIARSSAIHLKLIVWAPANDRDFPSEIILCVSEQLFKQKEKTRLAQRGLVVDQRQAQSSRLDCFIISPTNRLIIHLYLLAQTCSCPLIQEHSKQIHKRKKERKEKKGEMDVDSFLFVCSNESCYFHIILPPLLCFNC